MNYLRDAALLEVKQEYIDVCYCLAALLNAGVPEISPTRKLLEERRAKLLNELNSYEE